MDNWKTANPMLYNLLQGKAKHMRQYPTQAESALWSQLRNNRLGVKFLRQHVIDEFIADFYCPDKMLIVEVDGGCHCEEEQMVDDAKRTQVLESLGMRVIRFTNEQVLVEPDKVISEIQKYI